MLKFIDNAIKAEINYYRASGFGNKLLCNIRLLLAVLYTGFIAFNLALFCVLGADATEREAWNFLANMASIGFVILLLLFPPRIATRHSVFIIVFVLLNLLAIIFPMALDYFWATLEGTAIKIDFQVIPWFVSMMLLPSVFLCMHLALKKKNPKAV